ncbi:gastrula zinc finger protein XlCGF26.1-like [Culicoides brevitarsis]|uniref:gastrula zinc finger protein XlCGF26.1-like n=1 Tax=Culicoides brevitarsis TaxID=469753 RepID=UPI00307B4621
MLKKLFIVLDVDEHGQILDYNIDETLTNAVHTNFDLRTNLIKRTKCPHCTGDLEYSMLLPSLDVKPDIKLDEDEKCLLEEVEDAEFQEEIYEIIEEEVQDEEHFRNVTLENEENIATVNLKIEPVGDSIKKNTKPKNVRSKICKKEVLDDEEDENFEEKSGVLPPKNVCPDCPKAFRLASTLRVHIQRCHTPKSFCCHVCGAAFARNKELQEHLLRHENPKPYECALCSERYAVKNSLRDHMRAAHLRSASEGIFCEFCDNSKKYPTEAKLLDHHARVHSGNDRYPCKECPRAFKYPESLRNHLTRYHTPPELMKWFSCNECNFRGTSAKALEKHKLVHLDNSEKPFKCSYCDKGFGRRYEWNRHEMIHRSEKNFICGICKHSVRTNYLLQKHMRVHQEGRPYACSLCDKKYRDRDTFKKHVKAHAVQMEAQGETLNLEEAMQNLANVHKTVPIKAKSFPVMVSPSEEALLVTEVQDDIVIETAGNVVVAKFA